MKKFQVTCTIIYNGCTEVEAENVKDAIEKVQEGLHHNNGPDEFPNEGSFGGVRFSWGEATADCADLVSDSDSNYPVLHPVSVSEERRRLLLEIKDILLHDAPLEPEDESGRIVNISAMADDGDQTALTVCEMFPQYKTLVAGVSFSDETYFVASSFSDNKWKAIDSLTDEQLRCLHELLI